MIINFIVYKVCGPNFQSTSICPSNLIFFSFIILSVSIFASAQELEWNVDANGFFDNMEYIRSVGESIYLKATPEVLAQHLKMRKVERPLLKGKSDDELIDFIRTSLQEREPYYLKAEHIIDVTLLDNYDKLQTSVQLIRTELGL